jgi:predicted ATP-dependent serine protease
MFKSFISENLFVNKINEIKKTTFKKQEPTIKTGFEVFDNWFSKNGGIVIGSSIYVSGTSGAGKTTLMLNILSWIKDEISVFYSREMTKEQILNQVGNLNFSDKVFISDKYDCQNFDSFMNEIETLRPKIIIIDSLQFIAKEDYAMLDIMSEEKACYEIIKRLREYLNKNKSILFLIGHNTKDGNFAGVNTIIQSVDAHIDMVYEKKENSRTMSWGVKNRNGEMGSIPYFIKDGNIFFENKENNKNIKNYDKIIKETVCFLEEKIETIKYNSLGEEINKDLIKKLKKDYYKLKKQHLKYIDNNSDYYFPKIFVQEVLMNYFKLIENLEYFTENVE